MVSEAPLARTDNGVVPNGEGWFVVNACEAPWEDYGPLGTFCLFEGEKRFPQVGINLSILQPGQPSCMYHAEDGQEDFLVLAGECLLLVEEEERPLRSWDFFHCPTGTRHVFVGAGSGPCLLLSVGARLASSGVVYPVSELARRYGAGVERETRLPREAYAPYPEPVTVACSDGWLPDL